MKDDDVLEVGKYITQMQKKCPYKQKPAIDTFTDAATGDTLLARACALGNAQIVTSLLVHSNVAMQNAEGNNSLMLAASAGHTEVRVICIRALRATDMHAIIGCRNSS